MIQTEEVGDLATQDSLTYASKALELGIQTELHTNLINSITDRLVSEFKEEVHNIVTNHVRQYTIGNLQQFRDHLKATEEIHLSLYVNDELESEDTV